MSAPFLFLAAFLACAVEMVEALTIVLAVGVVRGWRSTRLGVGVATLALAALVAALGPALQLLPIDALRLLVGLLLLTFGLRESSQPPPPESLPLTGRHRRRE